MKVLIAYCSRYGTARSCAATIAQHLTVPVDIVDLGATRAVELSPYDVVVIGGSVYAGKTERKILSFCDLHREELEKKSLAVYLCCLYQGERALQQLHAAYPDWLLAHAFHAALPGGELTYRRLRWGDRIAVRGLPHAREDVRALKPRVLEELAAAVNERLRPS